MKIIIVLLVLLLCVVGCEGGSIMPPGYWSEQIREQQAEQRIRDIEYRLDEFGLY